VFGASFALDRQSWSAMMSSLGSNCVPVVLSLVVPPTQRKSGQHIEH
jgi:hypothetical protein